MLWAAVEYSVLRIRFAKLLRETASLNGYAEA